MGQGHLLIRHAAQNVASGGVGTAGGDAADTTPIPAWGLGVFLNVLPSVCGAGPRLRDFTMPLGEHVRRGDIGERRLQFILPAGDDVALTLHHCLEAGLRDVCRIVLLLLPDRGVEHVGTRKNSVSVAPGIRHVTVTLVSCNSFRSANENELRKALVPL